MQFFNSIFTWQLAHENHPITFKQSIPNSAAENTKSHHIQNIVSHCKG